MKYNQKIIGISIYNSFVNDLREMVNNTPSNKLSNIDKLYLIPCFNFLNILNN